MFIPSELLVDVALNEVTRVYVGCSIDIYFGKFGVFGGFKVSNDIKFGQYFNIERWLSHLMAYHEDFSHLILYWIIALSE
jgi:hypothetical protein